MIEGGDRYISGAQELILNVTATPDPMNSHLSYRWVRVFALAFSHGGNLQYYLHQACEEIYETDQGYERGVCFSAIIPPGTLNTLRYDSWIRFPPQAFTIRTWRLHPRYNLEGFLIAELCSRPCVFLQWIART